jgi:hypothetical protein
LRDASKFTVSKILFNRELGWRPADYVRCTHVATDGTRALSVRNSMYHPGGAMFLSGVTLTVSCPPPCARISRSTSRCPESKEWVVTQFLIRLAQRMFPACGDRMVTVWPYYHSVATAPISGRAP